MALRSGWLGWAHVDAVPVLWSPWTATLGTFAHVFRDPGTALGASRALAFVLLAAGLLFRTRRLRVESRVLVLLVALSFDCVVAHLFEFRYDTALLVLTLLFEARLVQGERPLGFEAGVWLGLILTHQAKGLVLGGGLFVLALASRRTRPELLRVVVAAVAVVTLWLGVSTLVGMNGAIFEGLRLYSALATDAPRDGRAFIEVLPALVGLLTLIAVASVLVLRRDAAPQATTTSSTTPARAPALRWFIVRGAAFVFLAITLIHPYSYAYHFTPVLLLLSIAFVERLEELAPSKILGVAALVPVAWLAAFCFFGRGPIPSVERVTTPSLDATISTLRLVRTAEQPGDRALDPSGLLYFLPPCSRQWYADVLFEKWIEQRGWMNEPLTLPCQWTVRTSRLERVPRARLEELGPVFFHAETGGLCTSTRRTTSLPRAGLGTRTDSVW